MEEGALTAKAGHFSCRAGSGSQRTPCADGCQRKQILKQDLTFCWQVRRETGRSEQYYFLLGLDTNDTNDYIEQIASYSRYTPCRRAALKNHSQVSFSRRRRRPLLLRPSHALLLVLIHFLHAPRTKRFLVGLLRHRTTDEAPQLVVPPS